MAHDPRIVIVDDNADDRLLAVRDLRREFPGFEAIEVADADGLARVLESADFDLVITDYQLHWTDGLKILRDVKARNPDCPVVMLTGTGSEEIAVEAMKAGLDDYVLKSPKHLARLPAAVRSALDEAERRRAAAEAEERYRCLVETSPDAVVVHSGGKFVYLNPAAVRLLGAASPDDLIGKPAMDIVHPDDRRIVAEQIRKGTEERMPMPVEEERFVRVDGGVIDAEVAASPIMYAGKPSVQVVARDISERKRVDQFKSDFVAMVSHELRTPLAIILGYASLIERSSELAEDPGVFLNAAHKIQERGALMRRLVEDLLEISRIEARGVTLSMQETNVRELVTRSAESVPMTERHSLKLDIPDDVPTVRCDPTQLSMAVMNLISNAVKFSPKSGPIRVRVREKAGRVVVSVADKGIGIEAKDIGRIFDRFVQADMSMTRAFPGVGMGLYITREIVEAHGGRIRVRSAPGKGSTFTIEIPIEQGEMAA